MRIGLYISSAPAPPLDELIGRAQRAEAAGLHTVWVSHLYDYDALTLAAVLGRETSRIELGTWVVPTYPRHPSVMAQQALTVQASSGGRLVLGIGLSHEAVMSKRLGIPFTRPVGHMRDYLEVLMPLLQGARVDHSGVEHHVRLQLGVPGVAAPQVLVGALGPQMLRLTGRLADGAAIWLGGQRYLEDFALPLLNESARKAGRPAPRVAVGLAVAVCDDIDEGREAVGRAIDRSAALPSYRAVLERGGAESASETALIGPEDEVRARLRDLARLGVSDFHAIPVGVGPAADSLARTHALLAECARGLD